MPTTTATNYVNFSVIIRLESSISYKCNCQNQDKSRDLIEMAWREI